MKPTPAKTPRLLVPLGDTSGCPQGPPTPGQHHSCHPKPGLAPSPSFRDSICHALFWGKTQLPWAMRDSGGRGNPPSHHTERGGEDLGQSGLQAHVHGLRPKNRREMGRGGCEGVSPVETQAEGRIPRANPSAQQ